MPIYEYVCRDCSEEFETWVRKPDDTPACRACGSAGLDKKLSLPRLHTSGSHDKAMRAAKKRDAKQQARDMHARLDYEHSHDD